MRIAEHVGIPFCRTLLCLVSKFREKCLIAMVVSIAPLKWCGLEQVVPNWMAC